MPGGPNSVAVRARQPDVGVAGGLGVVVGLGLDDHARRCRRGATTQPTRSGRDLEDRAGRRTRPATAHGSQQRAGRRELLAHARQRGAALATPWTPATSAARAPRVASPSSVLASCGSSSARARQAAPGVHGRRAPGRRRCRGHSRNGTPRLTSRSARSVAAISSSDGRGGHALAVERRAARACPRAAARHSASVSTASKRCSLSSCRSLL